MNNLAKYSSSGLSRRGFLQSSIALVGTSVAAWGQTTPTKSSDVDVETMYGRVRGVRGNGLVTFKGIPYSTNHSNRHAR